MCACVCVFESKYNLLVGDNKKKNSDNNVTPVYKV